jgi:membrane associated rhomboid family serine protease
VLPLYDDNPVSRRPVVTLLIIAACVVAYFFWQPTPFEDTNDDIRFDLRYAAIPCEVLENRPLTQAEVGATFNLGDNNACNIDRGQTPTFDPGKIVWLAIITSMFLHGSLIHLGGNMLFLWIFGNNVEDAMGPFRFIAFYLLGGLAADAAQILVNSGSTVPTLGASGAVAAVLGGYLLLFPRARVVTFVFIIFYFTILELPAILFLGIWILQQALFAYFDLVQPTGNGGGVAYFAHIGGFALGLLTVRLLAKEERRRRQLERAR